MAAKKKNIQANKSSKPVTMKTILLPFEVVLKKLHAPESNYIEDFNRDQISVSAAFQNLLQHRLPTKRCYTWNNL